MSTQSNPPYGPVAELEEEPLIPFLKDAPELEACQYCDFHQSPGFTFCASCGSRRKELQTDDIQIRETYRNSLTSLALYGVYMIILVVLMFNTDESFKSQRWLSYGDALITIGFVLSVKGLWRIIAPASIDFKALFSIMAITLVSPFLVSTMIDWITSSINADVYDYIFWDAPEPLSFTLILIAVFPAIFEELTFRGFVYHHLQKISSPKAALWVSAILFAMVHFSLISLFWLIPFGLLLGYYRQKHNTLFYGIVGHFMHNAGVVLAQYYGWY